MYYAVILAGGPGTRLWPLNQQGDPQQAPRLVGEHTMFQQAVERLAPLFPPERIFIVTPAEYAPVLRAQTPEIPGDQFLCEPEGRGTAAAIGLAAIVLRQRDPYAVMAVLSADHSIGGQAGLLQALSAAKDLAGEGYLVTLGIKPDGPASGYGYIQPGEELEGSQAELPAYRVTRFIEKPDASTAQALVTDGGASWNSGMFVWHVNSILEEFELQMPDFYAQLEGLAACLGTSCFEEALQHTWPQVRKQSIAYGIMEGAQDVVELPVEIDWSNCVLTNMVDYANMVSLPFQCRNILAVK